MSKQVLFVLIFSFFITSACAQKITVNGAESKGKLKWSDFTGKADKNSSFAAYTSYYTGWKMGGAKVSGDSIIIEGFEVTLGLSDKDSWVKMERATPELLAHEQGHFNIGILTVREIVDKFKRTKFTQANFKQLLPQMMTDISQKYRALGILYDQETDHSKNVEMQNKWNKFFEERLPELYK